MALLSQDEVGIVYPEHADYIKPLINWGYNFDTIQRLLSNVGVKLDCYSILEFPSGSMFWGRSDALAPLLEQNLTWEDFSAEAGQIDGTLAHAIERSILFFAEAAGYQWRRTTTRMPDTVGDVDAHGEFHALTTSNLDARPFTALSIPETRRILPEKSKQPAKRSRVNLLLPTLAAHQMFGGISTALRIFKDLVTTIDADVRVIVTDQTVDKLPKILEDFEVQKLGTERSSEQVVLDCTDRNLKTTADARARHLHRYRLVDWLECLSLTKLPARVIWKSTPRHLSHSRLRAVVLWRVVSLRTLPVNLHAWRRHGRNLQLGRTGRILLKAI